MKKWLRILKTTSVIPLITGQTIYLFAQTSLLICFRLLIVNQPTSAIQVGILDLTTVLPAAIFSPFAGIIVDRFYNKKNLLVICSITSSIFLFPIAIFSNNTWLVYISSFMIAVIGSFLFPALFSITPLLVKQEDLLEANSIMDLFTLGGGILASIISSWLFQLYGARLLIFFSFILFLISAASFYRIIISGDEEKQSQKESSQTPTLQEAFKTARINFIKDFIDGLNHIVKIKWLGFWTIVFIGLGISDAFFYPYMVVWAKRDLVLLDSQYGQLSSMISLGSALGILFVIPYLSKKKPSYAIVALLATIGIILISLRFQQILWPVFILLLLFGMARTSSGLLVTTETQKHAPKEVRGRIMGAYQSIGEGAYSASVAVAGIIIDRTGVATAIFLSGMLFLLTGFFVIWLISRTKDGSPVFNERMGQ